MEYNNIDLRALFDSFSPEEIEINNLSSFEKAMEDYDSFSTSLDNGICYLCNESMESFDEQCFCLHWFAFHAQFKKKYFVKYFENKTVGFFNLEPYLRWLASTENGIKNISDLKKEMSNGAFYESTIKYRNIEWSFSIGNSDLIGHKNSSIGYESHYHIQMKIDGNIFIKFNDLHILFTEEDLFHIEFFKQNNERTQYINSFGVGISILENDKYLDLIEKNLIISDNEENATFNTTTIITAPEGQSISGDKIYEAIKKSKKTGKPLSHFINDISPEANMSKVIYPSESVTKLSKRSGR